MSVLNKKECHVMFKLAQEGVSCHVQASPRSSSYVVPLSTSLRTSYRPAMRLS